MDLSTMRIIGTGLEGDPAQNRQTWKAFVLNLDFPDHFRRMSNFREAKNLLCKSPGCVLLPVGDKLQVFTVREAAQLLREAGIWGQDVAGQARNEPAAAALTTLPLHKV